MNQFAFFHLGNDIQNATLLVRTIKGYHPDAKIIQCTDGSTPAIAGVDTVTRSEGDPEEVQLLKLAGFANTPIDRPTLYLNPDMIMLETVDLAAELADFDVAVCRRDYDRDVLLRLNYPDVIFNEYAWHTLDQAFPYLPFCTIAASNAFWADCLANLQTLHPKFRRRFGDQEAMRNVIDAGKYRAKFLPEIQWARLPDSPPGPDEPKPKLLHFKGEERAEAWRKLARETGTWPGN
jgi:hypothetical protein